jgi:ABC-type Fe3+ transport system substrate-binding protein
MLRTLSILAAMGAVVALPFLLRPAPPAAGHYDDTLVIVSPHNEAIRHEFSLGFRRWYRARTGRDVHLDWRALGGGGGDIARYLHGEFIGSFRNLWVGRMKRTWSAAVQAGFLNARLPANAPAEVREAREVFLHSDAGCGIDLYFGGGSYEFDRQAQAGVLVDSGIRRRHPDWFGEDAIPEARGGETYWDSQGRWAGCVVSCYGILYNRDCLRRLGMARSPETWADLADPRLAGQVALADPTMSGSAAEAFESIMQQQIRKAEELRPGSISKAPASGQDPFLRRGWLDGLRLLQAIGANARYFTDSAQKVPIDVSSGDCAAGLCIDFYGRQQEEAIRRRGDPGRLGFFSPVGGSVYSVDPVAVLRGAPHPDVAAAFVEYALSMDGQKLWSFRTGTPGGPEEYALRRLPARRDFYAHTEWDSLRSDPGTDPYRDGSTFTYHPEWTGGLFRELAFISRVFSEDTHPELVRAWKAICAAREPARSRALAILQDMSAVSYDRAEGPIRQALESRDQADEVRMARDLAGAFRRQYRLAEAVANGG